jgi:hypothetical protein
MHMTPAHMSRASGLCRRVYQPEAHRVSGPVLALSAACARVSSPFVGSPLLRPDWQICMSQVGKDTEAQAFLGKLDTDREVGGMVDATVRPGANYDVFILVHS